MASSIFQSNGLALSIYDPLWVSSSFVGDYSQRLTSYSHVIARLGGFLSAQFAMTQPLSTLEDWIENGLGRRVLVQAPGASTVWEGLIDNIEVSIVGYRFSIGPYLDIANKIKLIYSSIDTIVGLRVVLDYITDAASTAKYGILSQILSAAGMNATTATQIQQMALNKLRRPPRSEDLDVPAQALNFDMTISCAGYARMLEKYSYNDTTAGDINLSDKITNILQADLNGLFGDVSGIAANTFQVPAYEQNDSPAWDIIKALVGLGDVNLNRYQFGVYENRRALYAQVGTTVKYIRPLREGLSSIQNEAGGTVYPWQVRPGDWILVTDLLPARKIDTNLENDLRAIFAETVTFQAPDRLTINGSHTFKVEQRLAQLGLGGLGV